MTPDQGIPTDAPYMAQSYMAHDQPPFLYEIRVKGRLASEQWTDWFDDLVITTARGESTLRGRAPDHAALYGLLARLRDLAIPLVSVRVLDEDAQRRLARQGRQLDLIITAALVALYLLLIGGLATITVFVAPIINTALALTLLFAALAGLAHAFWLWSGQEPWRWITYALWPAAAITFLVFIPVSGILPDCTGHRGDALVARGRASLYTRLLAASCGGDQKPADWGCPAEQSYGRGAVSRSETGGWRNRRRSHIG